MTIAQTIRAEAHPTRQSFRVENNWIAWILEARDANYSQADQ